MKLPFFSRAAAAPQTKTSRALQVVYQNLPEAQWALTDYKSYVEEGYASNVVVYQAIEKIGNAIGAVNWKVKVDGELLDEHPLIDLINDPNPQQTGIEFWKAKVAYLLLSGNAYDERVMNSQRRPQELWTLRPDRMTAKMGQRGMPSEYAYGSGRQAVFPVNPVNGDSDIRHTRLFNGLSDVLGMSPVSAAAKAIDQHNEAMTWIQALLQNAAKPSGALMLEGDQSLSDEAFARLKQEIETSFAGSQNAGRPMLLEGGMKWAAMGLSPHDMDIINTKDSAARDISLAFGVPPLLLNIPGDNTFANYREARLGFYEDTVIPLMRMMVAELNAWLSPYFDGARLTPDYDSIEAIAEKRWTLWERIDASDEITVNEAREFKGLSPLPAPLGTMLMADLRASRRGHTSDRSNNGGPLAEAAYGDE